MSLKRCVHFCMQTSLCAWLWWSVHRVHLVRLCAPVCSMVAAMPRDSGTAIWVFSVIFFVWTSLCSWILPSTHNIMIHSLVILLQFFAVCHKCNSGESDVFVSCRVLTALTLSDEPSELDNDTNFAKTKSIWK